jgi:phage-related protein
MPRVFDWVESPGTTIKPKALVSSTEFGDGYSQRSPAGLHEIRDTWDVSFTDIDTAVADQIEAFLRDGLAYKAFDWTPPRRTVAQSFICTSYQRVLGSVVGLDSISATFEEDFSL